MEETFFFFNKYLQIWSFLAQKNDRRNLCPISDTSNQLDTVGVPHSMDVLSCFDPIVMVMCF